MEGDGGRGVRYLKTQIGNRADGSCFFFINVCNVYFGFKGFYLFCSHRARHENIIFFISYVFVFFELVNIAILENMRLFNAFKNNLPVR